MQEKIFQAQKSLLGIQQQLIEGQMRLAEPNAEGTEATQNADEALIAANWEEIEAGINNLLNSVSRFLHKLG